MKLLVFLITIFISTSVYAQGHDHQHRPSPMKKECLVKDWKPLQNSLDPLFVDEKPDKNFAVEGIYEERGSTDTVFKCKLVGYVMLSPDTAAHIKLHYIVERGKITSVVAERGSNIKFDPNPKHEGSH